MDAVRQPRIREKLILISDNDITDVLENTFSVDQDVFGHMETVDLKPNGRTIAVTNENKHEYVEYV